MRHKILVEKSHFHVVVQLCIEVGCEKEYCFSTNMKTLIEFNF